jgi:hypothetical protein
MSSMNRGIRSEAHSVPGLRSNGTDMGIVRHRGETLCGVRQRTDDVH